MKKKLIAIALILVLCTAGAFAIGIGFQIDMVGHKPVGGNIGLTIKLDEPPLAFLISFGGNPWRQDLLFAIDYWFLNNKFADIGARDSANWFVGLGGYASATFYKSYYYGLSYATSSNSKTYVGGAVGVRVPIGINFWVPRSIKIEPYFQLAPYIGLGIYPKDYYYFDLYGNGKQKKVYADWGIPLSFGCRFWF